MNNFPEIVSKMSLPRRFEAVAALVVITCLAVFAMQANPFAGETVAPFDRLLQFAGWHTIPSDRTAVHTERSDILDSQLPAWVTLKDQIRRGESPLWYPNGAGGQPISLELCNPAFLLFVLIKDNALAYYVVGLTKLAVSGFGCYLLLRVFLGWLPSIWGGAVFMLCGFNAAWFFWEQVTTSMWIPWLFWAAVRYFGTENPKWLPMITIVSLLLIFGGFPPVAAFGFYAFMLLVLAWNISRVVSSAQVGTDADAHIFRHSIRDTALPLLAVVISFLLAAVILIPFRDSMAGINLGVRTGGTPFSLDDLRLFLFYEDPPQVERTAYVGFPVIFFSLAGIFSAFRISNEKLKKFIFFNAILVVVTVLIAFGLLPGRLIRAIPVFHSNNWGRFIVVTLLALSFLSAAGLDFISTRSLQVLPARFRRLSSPNARRMIVTVLIVLIAIQFHFQKELFSRFNAVVPSAWFYPSTPSIAYVKERLKPLQSVLADASSYWFAGTLGAYGIPEWYAHSFRTDREREVLSELAFNRSKSPNTMVIDGKSIHFDSPLMEKLGIRYLLVSKTVGNARLLELPALSREPAPPLPSNSWRQHVLVPKDIVAGGIGFSFHTYGEKFAPANVLLMVYKDTGEKTAEAWLAGNEITEEEWGFFNFPDALPLKKGGYYLQISLPGYAGPRPLTAWATKTRASTDSFLEVNGSKTDLSLIWKIGYFEDMDTILKKWSMISLENDIVIYENRRVTNSAYFMKDLRPDSEADFSGLTVRQASVDRIDIDNSHLEAGWIVLPMRRYPGWKAYIDGREIRYDAYLDILPAIPVDGPAHITFAYEAESFRKGLMVSLTGIVIFFVFSGFCVVRRKRTE